MVVGIIMGIVTLKIRWNTLAPSMVAASYTEVSMPMMAARYMTEP